MLEATKDSTVFDARFRPKLPLDMCKFAMAPCRTPYPFIDARPAAYLDTSSVSCFRVVHRLSMLV